VAEAPVNLVTHRPLGTLPSVFSALPASMGALAIFHARPARRELHGLLPAKRAHADVIGAVR
jgi:hypothetical protein